MTRFTESTVEEAALAWLEAAGWRIAHGPDIAPDIPPVERLRDALPHVSFIGFTGTPIELQAALLSAEWAAA